ncbi:MAG: metalloregulator ArsR/SmtB family transcription factor [Eubacteriales bacterium]
MLQEKNATKTLDSSNHIQNAKVFKALCDPKRLAVLEILRKGEHCACDLIEHTGIAQSALSYHMKILVESNIVTARQEGKWIHYQISETGKETALYLLEALLDVKGINRDSHCK